MPEDDDATWAYAWPAGQKLADELPALVDCRDRAVADLGCGRGHCGLAALMHGAARVLFADGNPAAVARIAAVLAERDEHRGAATLHHWGDPLPGAPFDVLCGGDILYRPTHFAALIDTLATSLAPDGMCFLSDPRFQLDDELPLLASRRRLSWSTERRASGYTLVRVERSR